MKRVLLPIAMTFGLLLTSSLPVLANDTNDKKEQGKKDDSKKDDKKTLDEILKDQKKSSGFFDVYRDEKTGKGYVLLDQAVMNKPVLYSANTVNGALDTGHFKGQFREVKLLEFRRYFDRIDVVATNERYYFDKNSAISRAADTNISEAILVSLKVEAEKNGKIAVSLDDLFLNEQLHKVSPWPETDDEKNKNRFDLGKFTKEKSRIVAIENFPQNTHIIVDYVFTNENPKVLGNNELSDPRFVSVQIQHALIALPENDFEPRRDDARVGYFTQQVDDLTSDKHANYRDVINRWNLQKKNPQAAVSEPVKPITWWIENTTPMKWRSTIKDAVLSWNSSFEKAGIRNAIDVKIQPNDADWSPDDIRYNVLRWVSSPRPPFGGYGPSIANPLTGEIIAADIMLEYTFLKNRWTMAQFFTDGHASLNDFSNVDMYHGCTMGQSFLDSLNFGHAMGKSLAMNELEQEELLKQAMYYLILHEVGHTLGLNHNMKASQLYDHKEIHNSEKTQGIIIGSVMDYPTINFAPPGIEQGDFYQSKPGPYDDWVIQYGYSSALTDAAAEKQRLADILSRSTEPQLAFGNDADDMRSPGLHIDPRVNIYDLSNKAIDYAVDRFDLINDSYGKLKARALKPGESHHDLLVGANVVFKEYMAQANVISRYIGGIQIDRSVVGQKNAAQPYTPIPESTQKQAMNALSSYVFAPDAVQEMEPLYAFLQPQRRGFDAYDENEDPKLHSMVLGAQQQILNHIMHPSVLQRLSDSALYGNRYTLDKMLSDLTDAIFLTDLKSDVNSYRQNLQAEYVNRLISISGLISNSKYSYSAQAVAVYELDRIKSLIKNKRGNQSSKIHRFYLEERITSAFNIK